MKNPFRTLPSMSRRSLIAGSAMSLLLPTFGRAEVETNPDIVIVGAGAAGIAAAHALSERGIRYVMVEAGSRIGGRAYTETETFGVPFDHGAHWVQSETRNPYFERAKDGPYRFYRAPDNYRDPCG